MAPEDAAKIADLGADPDVVKNLIFDWSTPERRLEIGRFWIEHHERTGIWGAFDRDDVFGLPERFLGFFAADRPLQRGGLGPEIYYAFKQETWGQGVASEVVGAAVRHLFEARGAAAVEALVLAGLNPASTRLLERLGMGLVGRYPLAEYVGKACGETIAYELWRVETAAPESAEKCLKEAAFKIGPSLSPTGPPRRPRWRPPWYGPRPPADWCRALAKARLVSTWRPA